MPSGKTISDWEKEARKFGLYDFANSISTDKKTDMDNLEKSGLPCDDRISLSYKNFTKENKELISFLENHISAGEGFCVRACPNDEGKRQKFTRENKKDFLDFEGCKKFLESVVGENGNLFYVEITNWKPNKYGGIIFSGLENGRICRGEIANDLEKLSHGEEKPFASFIYDRKKAGHIENKTTWLISYDENAKYFLWKIFRDYIATGDSFSPFLWEGYFEFVARGEEVKFVDYKTNQGYLK